MRSIPPTNVGPIVSLRVASELTGTPPARLADLVRSGAVRSERIKGRVYVSLDDAERVARGEWEGGGRG
jgi:hypothetical protein